MQNETQTPKNDTAVETAMPTPTAQNSTNPFTSPSFPFPPPSTDQELENLLFSQPSLPRSQTASSFSSYSSATDNGLSHFETASNASSDLDDELLFLDSVTNRSSDYFIDLTSPVKQEEFQESDPFADINSFLSIPTKIQKTEDQTTNQKHVTSSTFLDLNTLQTPPTSPSLFLNSQTNSDLLGTTPPPTKFSPFDMPSPSPPPFQPNGLTNQPQNPFQNLGWQTAPTSVPNSLSSPPNLLSPSPNFLAPTPIKQESMIKQEAIPPLTSPQKPTKLDEKAVLNAFGKLEIF